MNERRLGQPRTEEERRERHKARFGTEKLPPRGTGLEQLKSLVAKMSTVTSRQVMELKKPKEMRLKALPVDVDVALSRSEVAKFDNGDVLTTTRSRKKVNVPVSVTKDEVLTTREVFTPTYGREKKKVVDTVPQTLKSKLDELCALAKYNIEKAGDNGYMRAFHEALRERKRKKGKLEAEDFAWARGRAAKNA